MQKIYNFLLTLTCISSNCLAQEFSDPTRTEYKNDAGLQGSKSGFFQTSTPINYPAGASSWWHLLDVRNTSTSLNYAMQFAGSFYDGHLYFRKTNNSSTQPWSRVLLETNGNVGIGTINIPTATLQINAPLSGISSMSFGAPNNYGNKNVPINSSTGGYNIDFYTWRDVRPDQIGGRIRAERINVHQNNDALIQAMDLSFFTSDGLEVTNLNERLRIRYNGNVGIGTPNPNYALEIYRPDQSTNRNAGS